MSCGCIAEKIALVWRSACHMEVGVTASEEFKDDKLSLDSMAIAVIFEVLEDFFVRCLEI
jgi:hypothetical protein